MALTAAFRCACGKSYLVYMPKQKLYGNIIDTDEGSIDLREIDEEEEKAGEIELARHVAADCGAEFIDGREKETRGVVCSICNKVTNPFADIEARFN